MNKNCDVSRLQRISNSRALWFAVDMEEWSFVVVRCEIVVRALKERLDIAGT